MPSSVESCPPESELFKRYLASNAPPPEASFAAHVEGCLACQATLDRLLTEGARPLLAAFPLLRAPGADLIPPPAPSHPPAMPGYEVLEELGRGGAAVVYRARQLGVGRLVALKVMLSGEHATTAERDRFLREAQTLARLRHPNLVQIHDAGLHNGLPFLVMELIDGSTLAKRIGGKPLDARQAARLLRTLALAVAAAHEKYVVHCDLKPGNVLLPTEGDDVKIADFGLARLVDGSADSRSSRAGMGTPNYMAPEQVVGRSAVGVPADVYGLGSVLYECLTARPPFLGATRDETLRQVLGDEPLPPRRLRPGLPRDLETICLRCLQKEPGQRYVSAGALAADLGRFLEGQPISARPASAMERGWRWCRRHPAVATLTASLALVVVAAFCVCLVLLHRAEAHARTAETSRQTAAENFARAERRSGELRQALLEFVQVGGNPGNGSAFRPHVSRLALLQHAARHYQALLEEQPGDSNLSVELAKLLARVAELEHEAGDLEAAVTTGRQACHWWKRVVSQDSESLSHRLEQAKCMTRYARGVTELGLTEGAKAIELAVRHFETLDGKALSEPQRAAIFDYLGLAADVLARQGRPEEALELCRRIRQWVERSRRDAPASNLLTYQATQAWHHEGLALSALGQEIAAVACWKEAFRLGYRSDVGASPLFAMVCFALMDRPDREPYYSVIVRNGEDEMRCAERAVATTAESPHVMSGLFLVADRLVRAHLRADQPGHARAVLDRLRKKIEPFTDRVSPGDSHVHEVIQWVLTLATLYQHCGDHGESLAAARKASAIITDCLRLPRTAAVSIRVAESAVRISFLLRKSGEPQEALAILDTTIPAVETAVRQAPHLATCVLGLYQMLEYAGKCHIALGQPDQAVAAWQRGVQVLRDGLKRQPSNALCRERLATRCCRLGKHFLSRGQPDAARPWLVEAREAKPADATTRREIDEAFRKLAQ